MKLCGELDQDNNRRLLDIRNGTIIYYISTGKLILMLSDTKRLLDGRIVSLYPKKMYYKDSDTPWCLIGELNELLNEIRETDIV